MEEAEHWLEKGRKLDVKRKYEKELFSVRFHINMLSNTKNFVIHQIGKEKIIVTSSEVEKLVIDYEDTRLTSRDSKGSAVLLHIGRLKKLANDLNIPDPRHNDNRGFNKY
ncbi:hypothetical protein [Psychrobacillus insolitus]|uniref:hypothetical protein n=1 Tax=Psychrobacillus insolitus TaxID=1461 RepID=UPI000DADA57D|nr:hypothetical protein [Psychrobacillus insolitus]